MSNNINLNDISYKEDYGVADLNKVSDVLLGNEFDILRIRHRRAFNKSFISFMSKNYSPGKKSNTTLESESRYEGE